MTGIVLALAIAAAGGVGAALRFAIDGSIPQRVREKFPWGIFAVNLSGSFVLGVMTGLALDDPVFSVLAIGVLGGYTTFSTASLEAVELLLKRRYAAALAYGPGMLVATVALAITGAWIAGFGGAG